MEQRQEEAVREAEAKVWQRAEKERAVAIQEVRRDLTAKHSEDVQRLENQLTQEADRQIREQEAHLRQEAMEEAIKQKEAAERRLEEALNENNRTWAEDCRQRVESVRSEEIAKAQKLREKMRRYEGKADLISAFLSVLSVIEYSKLMAVAAYSRYLRIQIRYEYFIKFWD